MKLRCGDCGKCRLCELARTDPKYQKHWQSRGPKTMASSESAKPVPSACAHTGKKVVGLDLLRDWRECDHPKKPLGGKVCGCQGCGPNCGGYEPEDVPSNFFHSFQDPLQIGPYRKASVAWASNQLVKDRHREALIGLTGREFEYAGGGGRGIVTCGGGKYFPMAVAMMTMLRDVGYEGTIECWHRSSCEPVNPKLLRGLQVDLIDLDEVSRLAGDNRLPCEASQTIGWGAKVYALTHTNLDQVIWLDADFIPLMDPTPLFDAGAETGLAYWTWTENWIRWNEMGWAVPPSSVPPGFQSGQFVIDRKRMWKMMVIWNWICQHFDFYCSDPKTRYVLGDQEAAMVAMTLLDCKPRTLGLSEWPSHGAAYKLDGVPFGEHPFLAKMFDHGPAYRQAMKVFSEVMSKGD